MISHYPWLFNVDNVEVEKERRMLEVLEKINFPTPTSMKRSGDIRMWVYVESRTCGQCISLVLHPSLTAGEAALRAGQEAGLGEAELEAMFIHEVGVDSNIYNSNDYLTAAAGCDGRVSGAASAPHREAAGRDPALGSLGGAGQVPHWG